MSYPSRTVEITSEFVQKTGRIKQVIKIFRKEDKEEDEESGKKIAHLELTEGSVQGRNFLVLLRLYGELFDEFRIWIHKGKLRYKYIKNGAELSYSPSDSLETVDQFNEYITNLIIDLMI